MKEKRTFNSPTLHLNCTIVKPSFKIFVGPSLRNIIFIHIHSFSEYLLINYAVSLIFAKETVLNKTGMIKAIMDLVGKRER